MTGRIHTREFKMSLVKAIANGETTNTQVCREHQIAPSVIARWKREYLQRGENAFGPDIPQPQDQTPQDVAALQSKIAELERLIGQQSYEISVLKKVLPKPPSKNAAK